MLLPFAVGKTPVSRVTAGEVVYNNRYVFVGLVLSFVVFFKSPDKLLINRHSFYGFAVVPNERHGPG